MTSIETITNPRPTADDDTFDFAKLEKTRDDYVGCFVREIVDRQEVPITALHCGKDAYYESVADLVENNVIQILGVEPTPSPRIDLNDLWLLETISSRMADVVCTEAEQRVGCSYRSSLLDVTDVEQQPDIDTALGDLLNQEQYQRETLKCNIMMSLAVASPESMTHKSFMKLSRLWVHQKMNGQDIAEAFVVIDIRKELEKADEAKLSKFAKLGRRAAEMLGIDLSPARAA